MTEVVILCSSKAGEVPKVVAKAWAVFTDVTRGDTVRWIFPFPYTTGRNRNSVPTGRYVTPGPLIPAAALITGTCPPTRMSASSPLRATIVGAVTNLANPSDRRAERSSWICDGANPAMMLADDAGDTRAALGITPGGPAIPPAVVTPPLRPPACSVVNPPNREPTESVVPLMMKLAPRLRARV